MWVQAIRRRPVVTHTSLLSPSPSVRGARESCSTPFLWSSGVTFGAGVGLWGWFGFGGQKSSGGRRSKSTREKAATPVQDFAADTRETQLLSVAPWLIPHDEVQTKVRLIVQRN